MANFRQVHTKIWKDDWFLDLQAEHKLFFIYLFTNEMASISGIYELSQRVMSFESGLTQKEIQAAFQEFQKAGKAYYDDGVVWIANLRKYHETSSNLVQTRIIKDITAVKDCPLKESYCEAYGIDRVSVESNGVSIPPYTYKSTYTSKYKSKSIPEKTTKKELNLVFPAPLNTESFRQTFEVEWVAARKEQKKPLTARAANLQLKELAKHPVAEAEAMVKQSIMNQWQGIFPLKDGINSNGNGRVSQPAPAVAGEF
jgi:hypothetical protein